MRNVYLNERTARDIDGQIQKVLRDLGNPEPPLRLELVRELLRLDLQYYSTTDESVLRRKIHQLKIGGKQVLARPTILLEAVRKRSLRALLLPDTRRILISEDLPPAKQRWGEAHEICHDIIEWHEEMAHGDPELMLRVTCEEKVESEANFAAGRLLFLRDAFKERLLDTSELTYGVIKGLSTEFGNTMTSTLWRTVESVEEPMFGLVSQHPVRTAVPGKPLVRYFLRSQSFENQFGRVTPESLFVSLRAFCRGGKGPIGSDDVLLTDIAGQEHVFHLETFFNHYDALTLGVHRGARKLVVGF